MAFIFNEVLASLELIEQENAERVSEIITEELEAQLPCLVKHEVKSQLSKIQDDISAL